MCVFNNQLSDFTLNSSHIFIELIVLTPLNVNLLNIPTITPILVFGFFQAHDMIVPVVSFNIPHTSISTS